MSNDPNIKQLQATIIELTNKIEQLEKEEEEIIENFQVSTNVLLEKIKDLEAANLGSRPQTALILKKLGILIPRCT
jgi:septation ring formation regulator EzrA